MSLFPIREDKKVLEEIKENPIKELIKRRRIQILVHSYIYYELNDNLILDETFDSWSNELVNLQKEYPEDSQDALYYEEFKKWDGSTGAFLQFDDDTRQRAFYLLRISGRKIKHEHKKIQQKSRVSGSKEIKRKKAAKQRSNSLF